MLRRTVSQAWIGIIVVLSITTMPAYAVEIFKFSDFLALSGNFGKTPAAGATAAAVPEPSSLLLVSLGALCLLSRRRHRNR